MHPASLTSDEKISTDKTGINSAYRRIHQGAHIGFAGIDGAGKSTQAGMLVNRLNAQGYLACRCENKDDFVVSTMTAIAARHGGATTREYFGSDAVDVARAFDTVRDHSQIVAPLKAMGYVAVQPRTAYCRVAVAEAYGSRNIEMVREITALCGAPDLTIFIDVPVDIAMERIERRGIDKMEPAFLLEFQAGLRRMAAMHDWIHIDGNKSVPDVLESVCREVSAWIECRNRS